jgi:FAD/FMN-containing dehydrogenase/Fe-S oxidoreductase
MATRLPPGEAGPRRARLREDDRGKIAALDLARLERTLRRAVRGDVRFDDGTRALYATDASNYRQAPLGVVLPRDAEDAAAAVSVVREFGAPLLSRGGGTSLAGQCCNAGVLLDFSRYMNRVLEIDAGRRLARVQPGCVLDTLRSAARAQGLTFAPDPATHDHCTLGGMLGNNSCGSHSLLAAREGRGLRTSDNTRSLDVLTYEGVRLEVGETGPAELERRIGQGGAVGRIYARLRELRDAYAAEIRERYPRLPRRVSGYNLDELLDENGFHVARALVGTESTCVTILEATLHLVAEPSARAMVVLGYEDAPTAAEDIVTVLEHQPSALEGIDGKLVEYIRQKGDHAAGLAAFPQGGAFLLVELAGESREDAEAQGRRLIERLRGSPRRPSSKLYGDPAEERKVWEIREGGLGSTAFVPGLPDMWPGWEDSAVPPDKVAPYLRALRDLLRRHGHDPALYGHYGQGCIHCRIGFDLYTAEGIARYRGFIDEAADLVLRFGGSLSGEHGDGQSRGALLEKMYGPRLIQAFRDFKRIWDPHWRMNPGKVVDADPPTSHLRLGADYSPPEPRTHFQYPEDRRSFSRAVLRCVGVGKCRREDGGTMCPSYRATREEKHSTRGRARLLFEMLNGEVLTGGWRDEAVKEALDLCLACKGCKSDCPVSVDMATYKAEFLSHYYDGRLRPRHAYAFGLLPLWARAAQLAPSVANLLTQTPGLSWLAKRAAGMAPEREIPRFAPETFQQWLDRRRAAGPGSAPAARPRAILFADTFNNHFFPDTARHALEALEAAGFAVEVPRGFLCCGRPLYDYGFLERARRWLRRVLDRLRTPLRAGTPVVVLEPSCAAVFRDELGGLFPDDADARRLREQTFLLADFLQQRAPSWQPPSLPRKALVHGHCHQKALFGLEGTRQLLERMGVEARAPDSGCCGMAGAFGFEAGEHYRVAVSCGERVLLPEIRAANAETLIVADGFSCREQVAQSTRRQALHVADVIHLATREVATSGRELVSAAAAGRGRR